jgi:hypothetical protein
LETKPFLNRQLTVALITLGIATSIALTVWAMKNKEEQRHSVSLRLLFVKSVQESTADAIIIFQTCQKGRLSRNHKDYQYHLKLARKSLESQHPVGLRVDSAGEIGEIARSDNDFVAFLAAVSEDKVKVGFQGHDGIAHLERQHPRFETIERDLHRSLKEKKRIWFVWKGPRLTLEDVMIVEEDIKATKLTDLAALPAEFRAAAEAAANYLKGKGEEPSEFYLSDMSRRGKTLVLSLWHISGFPLKKRAVGNPGGKCRNLEYDTVTGRIMKELFWQ